MKVSILVKAMRKTAVCAVLVAVSTLFPGAEGAKGLIGVQAAQAAPVIRAIKVTGNGRVEPETVKSYLQFATGDRYDAYKVDDSLKALFATGLFSDVQIYRQGGTVFVSIKENPIINRVAFEGNSEIDDKTLAAEVQMKPRSVYTRAKVQSDVQRILDVYQRQGRFAAHVEPKIINLDHNRVNLVYEIQEGQKTTVQNINFIGNIAFSDSQLRDVVTTSETGWFSFFSSTNIYDPDRLNLDRELLRQFYIKNGYADARVVSAYADLDSEGSGFYITFTVEEGALYNFGAVEIDSSFDALDPVAFRSKLLTLPGAVYNAAKIDKTTEALTLAAAEQGFAFARVRPRVQRDEAGRLINITYMIERGPRIYIERINVIGNVRTRDYVIRREFRLVEGDAFNRLMVKRARRRLQGLGFFKKVDIQRAAGSAPDRVVLNVIVEEQSTGDLSFSGGYSSNEGVVGEISITERNLLGKGQYLKLKLSGSMERAQIDLSFTEPRFLDRNLSAGFDAFHKEVDYSGDSGGYKMRRTGGQLRLGFPINDDAWMSTRYNFVREEVFEVESHAAADITEGETYVSSLGYTLRYDTRNHKRKPTRGLYLSLSQDVAGLGGDVNYIRSSAEARGYYPLTENITLVGRVIGGHIEGWGGQEVRSVDLYRRGGETIRGFSRHGFGPRNAAGTAVGGKVYVAGTVEARFPLPLVPENLGLSGALFADAGTLYDSIDTDPTTNDDNSIRSSVGASLLWDSPLGPLRADFAYVLTDEDYDENQMFRFGASTKF